MESPSKLSIKRLESNVQRERNIASEWENKYKEAEKEKADLTQIVVDLRRELISLNTKVKKCSKVEERLSVALKELEACQKTIAEQRNNLSEYKEEMERVRFNANESISKWKEAESQWLSNTEILKNQLSELEQQLLQQKKINEEYEESANHLKQKLEFEQRIKEQAKISTAELEEQFKEAMSNLNDEQNKMYNLQESLQNLERTNDHYSELLREKETEIELLRAECNKHAEHESKWNNIESELIGKINAEKVLSGRVVALYETTSLDLENAKKENTRLLNMIESLNRKIKLNDQNEEIMMRKISEAKEKYEQMQEAHSKKLVEVREKELIISQLELAKKKQDGNVSTLEFVKEKLRKEQQLLQTNYNSLAESKTQLEEQHQVLFNELSEIRSKNDKAEEEMVLLKAELEEKMQRIYSENKMLTSHIEQRQRIVDDLSNELSKSNKTASEYRTELVKLEQKLVSINEDYETLKEDSKLHKLTANVNEELFRKSLVANDYYLLQDEIWYTALEERCYCFGETTDIMRQAHNKLMYSVFIEEEKLGRQEIFVEYQAVILEMLCSERIVHICLAESMKENNNNLLAKLAEEQEKVSNLTKSITQLKSESKEIEFQQTVIQSNLADSNKKLTSQIQELKNENCEIERLSAREVQWWKLINETWIEHNTLSADVTIDALENTFLEYITSLTQEFTSTKMRLANEIEDMKHFVQEAKKSIEEERMSSLCQLRNLIDHKALIQGKLEKCEYDKEELEKQVSELIHQQEHHQQYIDKLHQESDEHLLKSEALCNELKSEVEKSERKLKYEIDRKLQYKNALIQLKKLRLELEECRQKEKSLAIAAVKKANEETQYWRDSFEKLKMMISEKNNNEEKLPLRHLCENVNNDDFSSSKSKLKEERTLTQSLPIQTHSNENIYTEENSKMPTAFKRSRADSV